MTLPTSAARRQNPLSLDSNSSLAHCISSMSRQSCPCSCCSTCVHTGPVTQVRLRHLCDQISGGLSGMSESSIDNSARTGRDSRSRGTTTGLATTGA
jgi:hypothetical protein